MLRTLLLSAMIVALPAVGRAQDASATAATQQVELGEQWFRARCTECHATASLSNADFQLKWTGKNAFDLYELIRSTMPEDSPGSLTAETYTAIVSYLMKLNGMPVGTAALPADSAGMAAVRLSFGTPKGRTNATNSPR